MPPPNPSDPRQLRNPGRALPSSEPLGYYPVPVEQPTSVREYFVLFRRYLWLILAAGLVGLSLAVWQVRSEKPRYSARAVIRLVDKRPPFAGGMAAAGAIVGSPASNLASQIQVLQSRSVLGDVVDREGLRLSFVQGELPWGLLEDVEIPSEASADSIFLQFAPESLTLKVGNQEAVQGTYGGRLQAGGLSLAVASPPDVPSTVLTLASRENVIDELRARFRATPREGTDIIDLEYIDTDPERAQRVVNAAAEVFQLLNVQTARSESGRRREFLETQLRQTDSVLSEAQLALSSFRDRTEVYGSKQQFEAQQSGLVGVDVRREELDSDRRIASNLLSQLQSGRGGNSRDVLRSVVSSGVDLGPVVSRHYEQLIEYETARERLVTEGRALSHPDVQRLDTLILSSQAKIVDAMRSQMASLDARIAALDSLKARSTAEVRTLSELGTEEQRLLRQVEMLQELMAQLQAERQRARLEEAVEGGQVEIVDLARLPTQPLGTGHTRTMLMGLLVGLMLGGGGAVLLDKMNTSIRRQDEIEAALHVPGLAIIPRINATNGSGEKRHFLPARVKGNRDAPARGQGEELVAVADTRSATAEAFRRLRTNLIFSQEIDSLRTLAVTSATPGEGKTTTAANLAAAYAQQGMRVLLIDCDLRRARVHKLFHLPQSPGLTELLQGSISPSEVIYRASVEGLSVLTAGSLPVNPAELLGSPRLKKVMDLLGQGFDAIILDTPPLMAASDAAILGARVDGVLMVVRAGHTERAAAQQSIQQLNAVGARVVGAVLNDPGAEVPKYGNYYYSYEYYGTEK